MEQQKKRILVAEDERPIARALELKLSYSGFDVKVAGDGAEALSFIGAEKFDLILLDLVMPEMDGFSVLERLKEQNNSIPVIILSNLSQIEDEKKARELGAKGFFVKANTPIADIVELVKETFSS